MNGWAWIILAGAWMSALCSAVAGLGLMAWAVWGRRAVSNAPASATAPLNTGQIAAICWGTAQATPCRRARCDCCGYELIGLEDGICPECGWSYETSRIPAHKRRRAAGAGLALLAVSGSLWLTPTIARNGWLSAVPTTALGAVMPYLPAGSTAVQTELGVRADLGKLGPWGRGLLVDQCASILGSRSPEPQRAAAADLLRKLSPEAGHVAAGLLELLDDPSAAVRACAVDVLTTAALQDETGQPRLVGVERAEIVQSLMRAAAKDGSEGVRRQAIDGLGRLGALESEAASVFVQAVRDPSSRVRERALHALYGRRVHRPDVSASELTVRAVEDAANDHNDHVRQAAVDALATLSSVSDAAVVAIGKALHDDLPEIRRQAAESLSTIGPRAAPAWAELMLSIDDEDPLVREAAMDALRTLQS